MGGQACILYGGAEFSRDLDLSIALDTDNLEAVEKALAYACCRQRLGCP